MAYGKYRHSTFYGEKGSTWNVEIWKDGYSGSSSEIDLSGEGFEITWNGQGGTRDRVFLGSECKLNCVVKDGTDESFLYDTLSSGYQEYFIRIYRGAVSDANLWWYGWIQPAFDKLENLPFPYVFQLTATDSYGFWSKKKEVTFANDTERNTAHSVRDILFTFINDMDLNILTGSNEAPIPTSFTWCRTSIDWYREGETNTSADPAVLYKAAKGFVNNTPTEDGDSNDSAFRYKPCDVFNGVLKAFNTIGFLAEGHYNFIQPNSLANNTSGNINVFEYNSALISNPSNPFALNTLLTIDQSSNVILGGSTITYEPSFESVSVNFKGGFSNFNITPGQLLDTEFYVGSLQSGLSGLLNLVFRAEYFERITSFSLSTNHSVDAWCYSTIGQLKIRLTDGSTTKYLKQTSGSGILTWVDTESPINVFRGFDADDSLPVNNNSYMAVGNTSVPYEQTGGPTRMYSPGTTSYHKFWTDMYFNASVEQPPITGDVYLEFSCNNYYYQRNNSTDAVITLPSQPTPTAGTPSITCQEIELTPGEYNEENNVSDGVTYTAIQDNNDAIEQFDLGDVKLGKSLINDLSSIKYGSGNDIVSGFRRGTSGDFKNPSVLLVSEFLELQVDPLEILQADIQSADISPLKLIKYSINGNSNFNYYSFLGGTFKAQSEILSGEWFRVSSVTSNFDDQEYYSGLRYVPSTTPQQKFNIQQATAFRGVLNNNSYGNSSEILVAGVSKTKIKLSAFSKGLIYSGQKLVLTYPDGSNPITLIADGDSTTSDTIIDLNSFTPDISYPVNSVLSPLSFDYTKLLTESRFVPSAGGSDTQVQFNDGNSFGGTDLITITDTDEITIGGPSGTNANILFNSGADLVLGADTAGGTSSTIQYLDSGSTARVMLGAYATNVVVLSNRAADGEVQIRANTSSAGGAGELIIATFKDTSVDFLADAELRGTNIGNIFNLEAYLTAVDFCMTTHGSHPAFTAKNGATSEISSSGLSQYATFQVPIGYQATHVQVNGGNSSSTFDVYACTITNATATALTSSPSVNTNQALSTYQLGQEGKYLSIKFTAGGTRREVYGAKITLARV
jgi:hypothetical protein